MPLRKRPIVSVDLRSSEQKEADLKKAALALAKAKRKGKK